MMNHIQSNEEKNRNVQKCQEKTKDIYGKT